MRKPKCFQHDGKIGVIERSSVWCTYSSATRPTVGAGHEERRSVLLLLFVHREFDCIILVIIIIIHNQLIRTLHISKQKKPFGRLESNTGWLLVVRIISRRRVQPNVEHLMRTNISCVSIRGRHLLGATCAVSFFSYGSSSPKLLLPKILLQRP